MLFFLSHAQKVGGTVPPAGPAPKSGGTPMNFDMYQKLKCYYGIIRVVSSPQHGFLSFILIETRRVLEVLPKITSLALLSLVLRYLCYLLLTYHLQVSN